MNERRQGVLVEAGLVGRGGRGGHGGAHELLEGVLGGARLRVLHGQRLRPRARAARAAARALLAHHVQRRAPRRALAAHCARKLIHGHHNTCQQNTIFNLFTIQFRFS